MKALTLWQPWASLVAEGCKPYEFRRWAAPFSVRGQRIAIHAGARPMKRVELLDLIELVETEGQVGTALVVEPALALLRGILAGTVEVPRSAVVCTAVLGVPVKAVDLPPEFADSDRVDHHVWGWPLSDIRRLTPPVPARGAQGFWTWEAADADRA